LNEDLYPRSEDGTTANPDNEAAININEERQDDDLDDIPDTLKNSHDPTGVPAITNNTTISETPAETKAEDGYDTDDSQEDEDRGEVDVIKKLHGIGYDVEEDAYDGSDDRRYEINHWHYHARKADAMWPAEEKTGNPQWTELIGELDRFAFDNKPAFNTWQSCWGDAGSYMAMEVEALHVAAGLGLTFWVEHLVKDLGKDPESSPKDGMRCKPPRSALATTTSKGCFSASLVWMPRPEARAAPGENALPCRKFSFVTRPRRL
jgi:hypothetical protein